MNKTFADISSYSVINSVLLSAIYSIIEGNYGS